MPNTYAISLNSGKGNILINDLFAENIHHEKELFVRESDNKTIKINKKIRYKSVSIYDNYNNPYSPEDYVVQYNEGIIVFKYSISNNVQIDYDEIPLVNLTQYDKLVVEFYTYWNGRYSTVPIGFENYGLMFYREYFGFTTNNNDIYGISALGLENKWIHVYAVFYNDITKNRLIINSQEMTLKQRTGVPIKRTISNNLKIGGFYNNETFNYDGYFDEFRIWTESHDLKVINKNRHRVLNQNDYDLSNLIVYYRFDEDNPVIRDYSYRNRAGFSVNCLFIKNTVPLDGYNKPQQVVILNPKTELGKNENYDMKFQILPTDPRFEEQTYLFNSRGAEDDTMFYKIPLNKKEWNKIIGLYVW